MKKDGCWIFLSHSSHDIHIVRMIRNEFEKYSHNPLAFHLKCLNADTPKGKKEIDSLIKREIDSREWFVFCDSPSARLSEYVQMERNYIHNNNKKKIWTIDVTASIDAIMAQVKEICTLIKVFISYSKRDARETFTMLKQQLVEKDFDVWDSEDLLPGRPFMDQIAEGIQATVDNGFIIVLITEGYLNSKYCIDELARIIDSDACIIPLVFGETRTPTILKQFRSYHIPSMPSKEDIHLIVELVEAELIRHLKGNRVQSTALNKISEINEKLNYSRHYHSQEAIYIGPAGGALDDYCELYRFPCCNLSVIVGDGPISRFRADGCCCDIKEGDM